MNVDTGEVVTRPLTKEERSSGKWINLTEKEVGEVDGMNREQRRAWARRRGRKMPTKRASK